MENKMKNKKLGIALLTLAVFTTTQTKDNSNDSQSDLYNPHAPWPFSVAEDVAVGAGATTAEIVTVGHADTGNASTGLIVAAPDALGAQYARKDKSNSKKSSSKAQSRKSRKEVRAEDAQ